MLLIFLFILFKITVVSIETEAVTFFLTCFSLPCILLSFVYIYDIRLCISVDISM